MERVADLLNDPEVEDVRAHAAKVRPHHNPPVPQAPLPMIHTL